MRLDHKREKTLCKYNPLIVISLFPLLAANGWKTIKYFNLSTGMAQDFTGISGELSKYGLKCFEDYFNGISVLLD